MRGWFKYVIITPSKDKQDFEVNPDYKMEFSKLSESEASMRDKVGVINIPDDHSF